MIEITKIDKITFRCSFDLEFYVMPQTAITSDTNILIYSVSVCHVIHILRLCQTSEVQAISNLSPADCKSED